MCYERGRMFRALTVNKVGLIAYNPIFATTNKSLVEVIATSDAMKFAL